MDRMYKHQEQSSKPYRHHHHQQHQEPLPPPPPPRMMECWSPDFNAVGKGYSIQERKKPTCGRGGGGRGKSSSRKSNTEPAWLEYEASHPGQAAAYWSEENRHHFHHHSHNNPGESAERGYYVLPPPPFDHHKATASLRKSTPRRRRTLATSQPCLQEALIAEPSMYDENPVVFQVPRGGYYTEEALHPPRHRPASSSSNYNRQLSSTSRRESPFFLPRSESFSARTSSNVHRHHEPSLSPLEVVRNKRASQAQWEKRKLVRASSVESCTQLLQKAVVVNPSASMNRKKTLHRSSSSRRRRAEENGFYVDEEEDRGPLDVVPPPPSPPCTCGKNLVLPPAPDFLPKTHQPTNEGFDSGVGIRDHSTAQVEASPRAKPQQGHSGSHNLRNGHIVIPRMTDAVLDNSNDEERKITTSLGNGGFHGRSPSHKAYVNVGISSEGGDEDIEASPFTPNGFRYVADEAAMVRNAALVAGRRRSNAVQSCSSVSPTSGGFRGSRSLRSPSSTSQRAKFIEDDERGISLEIGKFVALITVSGIHFRRQHWCILSLILLIIILCVAIGLPISDDGSPPSGFIPPQTEKERLELVSKLLTESPLIDGHNDLPWNIRKFIHNQLNLVNFTDNLTTIAPWKNSDWSHTDLKRLRAGKVGAQFWVAYAPCGSQHKDSVQITLEQIDLIKRFINQYPTYLQFVNDSQALIEAHAEGRIASLISVESGHAIGTSLGVLRMFQRLGAISMTLTHNCNTPWADCSKVDKFDGLPEHNGLTSFGKIVISEMNRLGMIIDLSHSSRKTALDAIAASEAPVIFSHSSAYSLCNSTRNVPDDILKAVARKNGLVMVNFFSYFLTCSNISSIEDVVAHLNHIRKVAGIDHVGIGASYDGINGPPKGLEDVSKYPYLFSSLMTTGKWSPEDLKKLAGLNFLRVFQEIEKVSLKMRVTDVPSEDLIDGKYIKDHTNCKTVAKRDANSTNC